MRSATSRRPASAFKIVSLTVLALTVGGAGTVGGLWAGGMVDLPFLTKPKEEPDIRGLMAVPMCSRLIPAYTKITRDFLLDPKTGRPKVLYLPPEVVQQSGMITDLKKIIGRVANRDKGIDYAFTEEDFLPKGTRPGLVAGIPVGKRAMTVAADQIPGLHALKAGDRLDILATRPIDMQKIFSQSRGGGAVGGTAGVQIGILAQQKTAMVRVLVQNGVLVTPVTTRVVPISSSSLTQGTVTRTKPVQEAVIAVDPEEIAPLTEALAVEAGLVCVARSGLPDDPGPSSVTPPGPDPAEQVAAVETLIGGRREVIYVPKTPGATATVASAVTPSRPTGEKKRPPGTTAILGRAVSRIP